MDDLTSKIEELNNNLSILQTNYMQNNANIVKLFSYILNKLNYLENNVSNSESSYVKNEISEVKEYIKNSVNNASADLKKMLEDESNKTSLRIGNIENKCKPANNYIIIDTTDSVWMKFSKVRKFFYMLFHFRKICRQLENEHYALEEAVKIEAENQKINEEIKQQQEEQSKINARNEIKNILNHVK